MVNNSESAEVRKSALFERKPRHIYADQLLCLLVLLGMAVLKSGTRSLGLAAFAVVSAVLIDLFCCRLTKKIYNPRDLSTVTSGLCLALMSPAVLPYTFIIFGSSLAIGVKHIFGGKDNYIFNPTAVSLAFLIICFPGRMLLFPAAGELQPLFGEAAFTPTNGLEFLLLRLSAFPVISSMDFLLGNFAGPIGTTHVLIIVVSGICLLCRRSVSPVVTISCLSVITIFRLLFPVYEDVIGALTREIFGGYLLFALIFLANDPQTVPKTIFGRLYYGVLLGVFTILFRGFDDGLFRGRVEGWFIFAILASNTFSYRMDAIAESIRLRVYRTADSLSEKLSAYEHFSENAKTGYHPELSDTQEINLSLSDYDMPPIDNKIIKVERKKRNVLTVAKELTRSVKKNKNDASDAGAEHASKNPPFILLAFSSLFEALKKPFDYLLRKPMEITPMIDIESINAEEEPEIESGVDIADFEEFTVKEEKTNDEQS